MKECIFLYVSKIFICLSFAQSNKKKIDIYLSDSKYSNFSKQVDKLYDFSLAKDLNFSIRLLTFLHKYTNSFCMTT